MNEEGVGLVKLRLLGMILAVALGANLVAGCSLLTKEPPAIGSLTVTDKVNERTREPIGAVSNFAPKPLQFFASAKVLNPRKGTRVQARWYYEDKLVDESDVQFEATGDRYVAFNLVAAQDKPFPSGQYQVRLFLDGKPQQQLDFKVE